MRSVPDLPSPPPPLWLRASTRLITAHVARRRRADRDAFPTERLRAERVDDGRVGGWWIPPVGTTRVVVVVAHGFGASATTMASTAARLSAAGAAVLVHDHQALPRMARGEPRPETPDRALTAAVLLAQGRGSGVPLRLLGHSLGGAAALGAAANVAAVDRVVTLAGVADPARTRMSVIPAWLNRQALTAMRRRGGPDLGAAIGVGAMRRRPDLLVLAVHGRADRVVPVGNALRLAAAGARLRLVEAAGHDPGRLFAETAEEVVDFLVTAPVADTRR